MRSDTQCWVSSSLFFMCIEKLGINDRIYYIPTGLECNNLELAYYVEHLFEELEMLERESLKDPNSIRFWNLERKEARSYVIKVGFILKAWAREGYGIKVV